MLLVKLLSEIFELTAQQTHNVAGMSLQRRCNVTTLQRRCNDVLATVCACWESFSGILATKQSDTSSCLENVLLYDHTLALYGTKTDLVLYVGLSDLFFVLQRFALYLEDYLTDENHTWEAGSTYEPY